MKNISPYSRWIQNVHENKVEASILANGLYWYGLKLTQRFQVEAKLLTQPLTIFPKNSIISAFLIRSKNLKTRFFEFLFRSSLK